MKRTLLTALPILTLAALAVGCNGGKEESTPVTVSSYTEYVDPVYKFAVRYPEGWKQTAQPGQQAVIVSSSNVFGAFVDFEPKGELGAKIQVTAKPGDESMLQQWIDEDLRSIFTDPSVLKGPESTTLNGMPAQKFTYTFTVQEIPFTVERYYVVKDSMMTYLETGVVGNFADYATVFDSVRASFRPAVPNMPSVRQIDTIEGTVQPKDSDLVEAPAADMKTYSGSNFSIGYPSNFSQGTGSAGGTKASVMFSGARNDSYYQVDVIDPQGLTLDKIVEQNKKAYGGRSASSTTIGGNKAYVFSYNPGKNVSSRAYFLMSGNNLYRITMNWFTPQSELYQPAFEKALGTFKAK